MVLVDSRGISRVPRYSGTRREPVSCRLPGCHRLWPIVPDRSTSRLVAHSLALKPDGPYNHTVQARWFGLFRVRSPLLAESLLFSVPVGTEMVHFPTLSSLRLWIQRRILRVYQRGFPHSEIPGSKLVCSSPGLIAAYRVLHRLLAPRHSPYALSSLTTSVSNSRGLGSGLEALGFRLRQLDLFSHCLLNSETSLRRFARQRVRKELPFAGYSVVK